MIDYDKGYYRCIAFKSNQKTFDKIPLQHILNERVIQCIHCKVYL